MIPLIIRWRLTATAVLSLTQENKVDLNSVGIILPDSRRPSAENIQILSKTRVCITAWGGVYFVATTSLKSNLYTAQVTQNTTENNCIISHSQNTTVIFKFRSPWPRGVRRRSAAARLLRSWDWIPPDAWMFVCCECCVLSGRGRGRGVLPTVVRRCVWSRKPKERGGHDPRWVAAP